MNGYQRVYTVPTMIRMGVGSGTSEGRMLWGPPMVWVPYQGWCPVEKEVE